jgi:hypothetical protein
MESFHYVKGCTKGNVFAFDSIFYACYHIMKCGFSIITCLVSRLVKV